MDHREKERCVQLAEYIVAHKGTVRATAAVFGVSKSTVHKDLTERLKKASPVLFKQERVGKDKKPFIMLKFI